MNVVWFAAFELTEGARFFFEDSKNVELDQRLTKSLSEPSFTSCYYALHRCKAYGLAIRA